MKKLALGALMAVLAVASMTPAAVAARDGGFGIGLGVGVGLGLAGCCWYGPRWGYPGWSYAGYYPSYYYPPYYAPPAQVVYAASSTVVYNTPAPVAPVSYAPPIVQVNPSSPAFVDASGRTCRQFQSPAGTSGIACLQPDGTWRVQ